MPPPSPERAIILSLAERHCGVTATEAASATGIDRSAMLRRLHAMIHNGGHVCVGRLAGIDSAFFRSAEHRDAWLIANSERAKAAHEAQIAAIAAKERERHRLAKQRHRAKANKVAKASPAVNAPVSIAEQRGQLRGVADYSRAKITHCPSIDHDPRFQLPPGAHPYGAGFSAVGVGRDVATGRGWV